MKKVLKISGIVILVIIVLLILLPIVFKKPILNKAKETLNESLEAKVEFEDLNISLIRNFPNVHVGLEEFTLSGKGKFANDTLARFKSFSVNLNLISVIQSDYKVRAIILQNPVIHARVLKDGTANWDIVKDDGTEEEVDTTGSEPMDIDVELKKFEISDAYIYYDDEQGNMSAAIEDFDFLLSGDMSRDFTSLDILTTIASMDVASSGIKYLKKANVDIKIGLDADMEHSVYTLKENSFGINGLVLNVDGRVSLSGEDKIDMDLKFGTDKTDFKSILSLVPAVYLTDFEDVQTTGTFALTGYANGTYYEEELPSLGLELKVNDAMFKYPDLPKSANNIEIDLNVFFDGVQQDNTTVDLNSFHVEIGDNPIDMTMNLRTPMSDPNVNATLVALIDFATFNQVLPLENTEIKGTLNSDIDIMGSMSTIENEQYEEFKAKGKFQLNDFVYDGPDFEQGIAIPAALLQLSPKMVNLSELKIITGNSDIQLKGELTNYLPYLFHDQTIKGNLSLHSGVLNLNELMTEEPEETRVEESDTTAMEVIEVPKNIDFNFISTINKLYFDNLDISNLKGVIEVKDGKVLLEQLKMNLLEGTLVINGEYNTRDIAEPKVDLNLDISRFDIPATFHAFELVEQLAPVARTAEGKFSMGLSYMSLLGEDMMPVIPTIAGSGNFSSNRIIVEGSSMFRKLGNTLKTEKFDKFSLEDVDFGFELKDGRVFVEPFEVNIGETDVIIAGDQGIDNTMNYILSLQVPRSMLGNAGSLMSDLTSQAATKGINIETSEEITMDALVGGTFSDPNISLNLKENLLQSGADIKEQLKQQARAEVEEKVEETKQEVKQEASKKAAEIIAKAEKEAARIKETAEKAAQKVRQEADANADKVVQEASGQPKILRKAAEASADKIRSEGDEKAQKIIDEADKKAEAVLDKARQEAAKLE